MEVLYSSRCKEPVSETKVSMKKSSEGDIFFPISTLRKENDLSLYE